ncbi:MAG TPA: LytTR family DNA-binding domain-containing protein [Azospirillaceae bacterium]|nr:LytTR family DNA-binding domain-containing protein [Azospirillaceae bacterium]
MRISASAAVFGPWPSPDRRLLPMAVPLVLAALALGDCLLYQLVAGGRTEPGLALRWFAGTLLPWLAAWHLLRRRVAERGLRPSVPEAAVLLAALAASVLLDLSLIPVEQGSEALLRLRARLPFALLVPLLARIGNLRALTAQRTPQPARAAAPQAPAPQAPADRTDPDMSVLAGARLLTAAGNYVEVETATGRQLLRMTLAAAEARLPPGRYLRLHRSAVVALDMVAAVERDREGIVAVRLADGRRQRVGRSHRAAVRAAEPALRHKPS